jgi:hypothetical protein
MLFPTTKFQFDQCGAEGPDALQGIGQQWPTVMATMIDEGLEFAVRS